MLLIVKHEASDYVWTTSDEGYFGQTKRNE